MIELISIKKVFNAGRPNEFTALNDVSISIEPHKITILKGPSGSGKTTLLSIIGCMSRPTAGRMKVFEREVTSLPERFLTEVRRNTFGFVFQQFNLIKGISVIENIMLPAYPLGEDRDKLIQRAMDILDVFNLKGKAHSNTEWLSGGEAQRAAIARALINNPSIIIADEPTAHLDTKLSYEFMDFMNEFKKEGRTVVIASHDPIVCDSSIIDRTVNVRDGRVF